MKLLVVSTWLPYPLDNGSRVRAFHLLRHLSRRHRLTLLSFGIPRGPEDLAPLRAFCDRVEVVPPTSLTGNRLKRRGLLSTTPRYFVQSDSPAMRSLLEEYLPNHDAALGLQVDAARYLIDHREVPRIFEEAEVGVLRERYLRETSLLRRWRDRMTWWKFRRYIHALVNSFERTTVVSAQEREHLAAIGCDVNRISVVPNGVETPASHRPARRVNRLIYTGSVRYFANLDAVRYFVHHIFPLIRRSHPGTSFTVTGSTSGVELGDLRSADGVEFTGQLPEVDTLVSESAVCVVPLRIGGGTRLKVLQAMALGTPVVSTSKGIEGLAVEANRDVLVADTPEDFAAQVGELLDDPAKGARLAVDAARLVREQYAWDQIGEVLAQVVEGAVLEHAAARRQGDTPR